MNILNELVSSIIGKAIWNWTKIYATDCGYSSLNENIGLIIKNIIDSYLCRGWATKFHQGAND